MKHRWTSVTLRPIVALGVAVSPWVLQAQPPADAVQDWRKANETVGQFPRGHADVLRWENAQTTAATAVQTATPIFALGSASDAIRAAWAVHQELATPLARLGQQTVGHIAAGSLDMVDPSLQIRIHGVDELLGIAARTRKAWLTAVAARQRVEHLEAALTAAEAAAELGRRMVSVGNWSRYQQAQFELGESSARLELKRSRLAAQETEWALLKAMSLHTVHEQVALPDLLPDMTASPIDEAVLRHRLVALQEHLPGAESRRAVANARRAYAAYTASIDAYRSYREEVLSQRELIGEESLFRYNGMLESVWTLLADVGLRSQAVVAAIGAQRDALIAETDLLWVLQGGQPEAFVSPGGGDQSASVAPGH